MAASTPKLGQAPADLTSGQAESTSSQPQAKGEMKVVEPVKPKIIASAFISSAPKKATKKRPAAAAKPPPSGSCRKFWALGRCEYGDSCKYSHTANPDVPPQAPPPASACKKFWVDGKCDFGDNCKFPHLPNPAIDPSTVGESSSIRGYKKAMKLGGSALDLGRWMDPKKMESYCVAPPTDAVMFHGAVAAVDGSQAVDGVDAPSEDIDAELAALQRMLAPQVLARVKRQLEQPEADNSAAAAVAVARSCTCHLMPGFNAQTGEKLVPCFNCNETALAEKKKALLASVQPQVGESSAWVPELRPVSEDAPGEEKADPMAALLDRIDGAKAAANGTSNVGPFHSGTWAEWEQWQKDNGLGDDEEDD